MNLLKIWHSRKFFITAAFLYILFFALFAFGQKSKVPDLPIVVMQMLGMIMIVFFSFLYDRQSISKTLLLIVLFQLICCYGLRFFNIEYFENPLGFDPQDAMGYHQHGSHIEKSFIVYLRYLDSIVQLDDYGFNLIVYFVYGLSGDPDMGIQLLVLFNIIAVTISSFFIYKLSNRFFDKADSCFIAFFWGTELYAVYTASIGLKENFMVMFVIIAIYYIMRVHKSLVSKDIIYAVLFSLPLLLFRTSVFYMLMCVLVYLLALRLPLVKRHIYVFILIIAVLATIYAYQAIDELALQQGYSYDMLQDFADRKVKKTGSLIYTLNYLASVIGPFPNMVANEMVKQNYITLYSFSSFCKVFYSFFMIYGIYGAFRRKHYEMIGIFLFWFLNTFMLLFTLFAQHDRYQWPHMPFTLVLACYGLMCWRDERHILKWDKLYFIFALLIILIFNLR
ncbi:MAG: glycosyltransferase family 39 protein [Muribaculaceae bacterium]|nr:glycosyltransferase family 39 protein [Muribaculaceae bacterium]